MSLKKLTLNLSTQSVGKIIDEIDDYTKSLPKKCQIFSERLADLGIKIAYDKTVSSGVAFIKEMENLEYGCKTLMIGKDLFKIHQQWVKQGGEVGEAEISPLLMSEFGSGWKAENPQNIEGFGQGTFPNQTHAFDVGGWSWFGLDNQWHHSTGIAPTMPMYSAFLEMYSQIEKIAKDVFGNG